jgi:hypothetical protein
MFYSRSTREASVRLLLLISFCSMLCFIPNAGRTADDARDNTGQYGETYRGHYIDFSGIAGRKDSAAMADALRHQIDIVEDLVGLSPQMREFFRAVPISVNELACLDFNKDPNGKDLEDLKHLLHGACYTHWLPKGSDIPSYGSAWDGNKWVNSDRLALGLDTVGAIFVRPITLRTPSEYAQRPILVHELMHAYHSTKMQRGPQNGAILMQYNQAKNEKLYAAEAYLLTNQMEFFAVTSSVFLYGKDGLLTRSIIKDKQPDYYKYLVFLFGFDPEPAQISSPLAFAQ